MRPTLVLGASGFLGSRLVETAVARARAAGDGAAEVVAVARGLDRAPERALAGARLRALDLVAEAEELLAGERPGCVLLVAALARVDACERDPDLARRTNAELPGRVATWCAANGARLIHVSTDLVFEGRPPHPAGYREEDTTSPLHVYGATKAAGERAVLAADPRALVVRLPLLFGDSGGRGLGASDWLLGAVARGEHPRLFTDEWRTPLEVSNAARALLELAAGELSGVLHVAGPERLTRFELGRAVLAAHGRSEVEIAGCVRPASRADAGLSEQRAEDVSLDSARARAWLSVELLAPRVALDRAPGRG